jgi:hypothetical protein
MPNGHNVPLPIPATSVQNSAQYVKNLIIYPKKTFSRLSLVLNSDLKCMLTSSWQSFGLENRRESAIIVTDGICLLFF